MFQRTILKDAKVLADADTSFTCDLPRSALIAAIFIRLYGTGGSGTPAVDDLITRVNIKSSAPSETYLDLDSAELRLRAKQLLSIEPSVTNALGAHTELNLLVMFGRKICDKRLMLDAAKHGTLQLTLSFGTLIATTAWATTTLRLDIEIIQWTEAKPSEYKGCVKQIHWTNIVTGTGWKDVPLPEGNKYDTICALFSDVTTVDEIIFGVDNKKKTPIATKLCNLLEMMTLQYEWATAETVQIILDFCYESTDRSGNIEAAYPAPKDHEYSLLVDRGDTTTTIEVFTFEIVE